MPLYEYKCEKCGHQFEKIQKFSDKMVKKCPECGGRVEQMISAPAVQFKGSGWYVTDYANKSHAPSSDGGSGVPLSLPAREPPARPARATLPRMVSEVRLAFWCR